MEQKLCPFKPHGFCDGSRGLEITCKSPSGESRGVGMSPVSVQWEN